MESLNKEDYEAKDKVFYGAMINAWLNTKIERDKQLLTLSVTVIGLLVTLLRTVGVSNFVQILLFGLALLCFLVTVISVIYILDKNAEHIEKMLNGSESENKTLKFLDKVAGISFGMGMVLIVIIGLHIAVINLNTEVISMTQNKSSDNRRQSERNIDSWNGVSKLRPQAPKASSSSSESTPNTSSPSATSGDNGSSNSDHNNE